MTTTRPSVERLVWHLDVLVGLSFCITDVAWTGVPPKCMFGSFMYDFISIMRRLCGRRGLGLECLAFWDGYLASEAILPRRSQHMEHYDLFVGMSSFSAVIMAFLYSSER
jgi:hypothetical protein